MNRKIKYDMTAYKRVLIALFFVLILLVSTFICNLYFAVQLIFSISIILSLFSLNSFEISFYYTNKKALLTRYIIGTIIGLLFGDLFTFYIQQISIINIIILFLFSSIVLYLFFLLQSDVYNTSMSGIKFLVLGDRTKYQNILNEIKNIKSYKISYYKFYDSIDNNISNIKKDIKYTNNILILDPNMKINDIASKLNLPTYTLNFIYLPELVEKTLSRIPIEIFDNFYEYYILSILEKRDDKLKRQFDIIFASIFLIISSPLFLFLSLFIYIVDKSPILFIQNRIGYKGVIFKIFKFRTMKNINNNSKQKYVKDEQDRFFYGSKTIRKFRVDELPQLVNVIKGELSLVGPRPEQVKFFNDLQNKYEQYSLRSNLKPGLTGLAQIKYKYASTEEQQLYKLSYDLYYVKNRSLSMDIQILLKTLEILIFKIGQE